MRSCRRKFLIGAVTVASIFICLFIESGFAEYLSAPELIAIEPVVPEEVVGVDVKLTVSPTTGFTPLPVVFDCTATAEIHYANERWALPPQGSSERLEPLYKTVAANITEQPEDQTIEKIGIHSFTAKAEYEGATGQDSVTVIVKKPNCADLFAKKTELEGELAKLNAENQGLIETSNKLTKEMRIYEELKKKIEEEAFELLVQLESISAEINELREKIMGAIKDGTINDQLEGIKEQWKVLKAKSRVVLHRFVEKENAGSRIDNKLDKLEDELDIIEAMLKEKGCLE
ncbi:MAG: hypothetical protein CVU78_01700 [Elusimicrobia bacterium HGW-Elusimicrobia-2]|nr:MAG: hypothetical protein CVU78_01700 [Elusimicrobia bacterium HGW-Elusimicrobia-2]